jgi:hypothetical protein
VEQVIEDLNSPYNRDAVDAINEREYEVSICPIPIGMSQDNGYSTAHDGEGASIGSDGTTPGKGSGSVIHYNPSYSQTYVGEDGLRYTQPPEDVLGHELIHSLHASRGEDRGDIPDTFPDGDDQEEARTMGIHGFETEPISERAISESRGRSTRPNHSEIESWTYQDVDGKWKHSVYDQNGRVRTQEIPAPDRRPNH